MDLIGKSLGNRYELLEKIGSGGMAIVYKAKCNLLKRYVAVKILKTEFNQDKEFLERFEIEAQASASLSHPNIVSVHDVGYEKGVHYIVMEYVEGSTLKEYIRQEGKLYWKDAINIAIQISSALSHAHKNKIVHRDIKPQNIIINDEGVGKVADFGIAKAVSSVTITKTGDTIGSVHYISPEQAQGNHVDASTDLYSLGVVIYEMVTGKMPFDGDNPVSIAMKHINETAESPHSIDKKIPLNLSNVIMKLLRKNPFERYSSANELRSDLYKIYANPNAEIDRSDKTEDQSTIMLKAIDTSKNKLKAKKPMIDTNKKRFLGMKISNLNSKNKKAIIKLVILGLVILLITTGIVKGVNWVVDFWAELTTPKVEYILENFEGIHIDTAVAKLNAEIQYLLYDILSEYNDNIEEGLIIYQSVAPGEEVKKILEITFRVSKGPQFVEVPVLEGLDYRNATLQLEGLGFRVTQNQEIHKDILENNVIRTEPAAGELLDHNSEITLIYSLGPEIKKVNVPNLIGLSEIEAIQKLIDLKLSLGESLPLERLDDELIKDQYPLPGTSVEEGEIVDIYFILDEETPPTNPETSNNPDKPDTTTKALPVKGERVTVNDAFTTLSSADYTKYTDIIKLYIEATPSDTGVTFIIHNSSYKKSTLPRTIEFSYEVPVDGSTKITILINGELADRYIKEK